MTKEGRQFEFVSRENTVDRWVIEEAYERNEYLKDFILPFVSQDGIVVDVGAHIGCFTVLAGEKLKPKLIAAIEPDPSNFDYLLRNIHKAGCLGIVRPFRIALGKAAGNRPLYSDDWNTGGNSFFPEKLSIEGADINALKGTDVPVTTLDMLVQELGLEKEQIGVLKIDAEGAEAQILEGSVKTLNRTAVVVGELHEALVPREKLQQLLGNFVVAFGVPFPPVNLTNFWAVKKELVQSDSGKQFLQQAYAGGVEDAIWRFKHNIADLEKRLNETANWATNLDRDLKSRDEECRNLRDRLNQEIKQFQATVQGQQHALDAKGHELVQLQSERDRLKHALDAKGRELIQLQSERDRFAREAERFQGVAQAHEQELAVIKATIGWKVLNKYRETREKSGFLRYLHFLFAEPLKRSYKKKIDIPYEATTLIPPDENSSSAGPQPLIIQKPDAKLPDSFSQMIALSKGFQNDLSLDVCLQSPSASARSVLVLGPWLPAMDRASGGLRAFSILQILREEGCSVVFGADHEKLEHVWFFGSEQELTQYEVMFDRLNIQVLYGSKDVMRHLNEKGCQYHWVVLSYPEVAYRYLPAIRAYAINAKVIYDPVDLHWLRMERESEIKNDDVLRRKSEVHRRMERFNAAAADIVFAITDEEKAAVLKDVPNAKVEVIPNIHTCVDTVKPLAGRKNLLFIGHYAHNPNEDAVSYFVSEIFPLIRQQIPGVVFYMVGSHMTEKVQSLAARDVVAVGYVPDPSTYFNDCRVFVAPLRYGAGMKGKIGHSMSFGLPVVTTSIGAEGMSLIDGKHVLIADSPVTFASAVVRLYTDDLLWEEMSRNALLHIQTNFAKTVLQTKIAQIFATESDSLRSLVTEIV